MPPWILLPIAACVPFACALPIGFLVRLVTRSTGRKSRRVVIILAGSAGGMLLIGTALLAGAMTEGFLQQLSPDNPVRYVHCRAFADGTLAVTFVIVNTEAEPLIIDSNQPLLFLYGGFRTELVTRLPGEATSTPLALAVASGQTRAVTVIARDTDKVKTFLSHAPAGCDCSVGYDWESQVHGVLELPASTSTSEGTAADR